MQFVPRPVQISTRVIAGLIDFSAIVVLSALSFAIPLLTRGIVLPMWGVLAVMVGYSVVPLAFLKKTLGFQVMGLELVGKDGHPVDLANLLFRELLGRGYFPAAWLFTIITSLIASFFRVGASTTPPMLAGVMTLACFFAVCIAAAGHFLGLSRDQRTLADLIAGSFVVKAPALPVPEDSEELAEWKAHRARVIRRIVVFEVVLMCSVLALPWLFSSSSGESPQMKVARLKMESLQSKFDANPGSESLAADLQHEYLRAGREEEAKAVFEKHRQALSLKEAGRELALREQLASQRERKTAEALIELLEGQDRVDDAEAVYRQYLGPTPTASERTGFGNWLATNGRTEAAVIELTHATTTSPLVPFGQTLLGVSLQRLGRFEEAREHLFLAVLDDPEDADAVDALVEVEEKAGPLSAKEKVSLRRRFDAWRRDAGINP